MKRTITFRPDQSPDPEYQIQETVDRIIDHLLEISPSEENNDESH